MENASTTQSRKTSQSKASSSMGQADIRPVEDMACYLRNFAQEKPEQAALWCLGIGFILGWKLKPW